MKDNRGFIKLLSAQNEEEEKRMIVEFFETIDNLKPSLVGGYNSAFFDFPFILVSGGGKYATLVSNGTNWIKMAGN